MERDFPIMSNNEKECLDQLINKINLKIVEDDIMNRELRERMDSLLKELNNKLFSKGIVYDACTMRRRNKNQFVIELISNDKHPRGYFIEMYDVLDSNNVCGGENAEPEYLITRQFVLDNYNSLCEIAKRLEFSKINYPKDYSLSNLLVWFGSEKQENELLENDKNNKKVDDNMNKSDINERLDKMIKTMERDLPINMIEFDHIIRELDNKDDNESTELRRKVNIILERIKNGKDKKISFDKLPGAGSFDDINKILNNNDCTNPKLDTIYPGKFSDYCAPQYNFNTQPNRIIKPSNRSLLLQYSSVSKRGASFGHIEHGLNTLINDSIKIEFEELHNLKHVLEKIYITNDCNNNANIIIHIKEYPSDMYENEEFNGRDLFIAVPLVISSNIFKGSMLMNQFTGFGIKRISAIEMMNTLRDLFEDVDILLVE